MTVKEKDKASQAEESRLAMRRSVRESIAEAELHNQKVREHQQLIAACGHRVDAATAEHSQNCQPIQAKLGDLEQKMLSALADRLPVPAKIGDERAKLLAQLDEESRKLETVIAAEKVSRALLTKELHKLQLGGPNLLVLQNRMAGIELANPQMFARHHGLQHVLEFLQAAAASADAKRERQLGYSANNVDEVAGAGHDADYTDLYQKRARLWTVAGSCAGELASKVRAELNTLRQAMIDE